MAVRNVPTFLPGAADDDGDASDRRIRREIARALMARGSSSDPVLHPMQGVARLGDSLVGALELYNLRQQEKREREEFAKIGADLARSHQPGSQIPAAAPVAQPQPKPASDTKPKSEDETLAEIWERMNGGPRDIGGMDSPPMARGIATAMPGSDMPAPGPPNGQGDGWKATGLDPAAWPMPNPHSNFDADGQWKPSATAGAAALNVGVPGQDVARTRAEQAQAQAERTARESGGDGWTQRLAEATAPQPVDMGLRQAIAAKLAGEPMQGDHSPASEGVFSRNLAGGPIDMAPNAQGVYERMPPLANAQFAEIAKAGGPLPQRYIDGIKQFEGFNPKPYWDYRQWTSGYGTRAAGPNEAIDRATAEQRLSDEVGKAQAIVERFAPNAPEGVKAALTSLTYNSGDKWTRSGLGQMVQSGDYAGAADRLQQYNKAGGKVLPGLVSRRAEEGKWMREPGAPAQQQAAASPQAQPQSPVQVAQSGGIDNDMLIRMLKHPDWRNHAVKYLIGQRTPMSEMDRAELDYKRAQTRKLDQETSGAGGGKDMREMLNRAQMAVEMGLDPQSAAGKRFILSGQIAPDALQPGQQDDTKIRNITGGLNELASLPDQFDSFDNAVGSFRGDETSWTGRTVGTLGRVWGSFTSAVERTGTSPSEVRRAIAGSTETLAASIKPLIRGPTEGVWSDADQQRLSSIIGDLAQANNKEEYYRGLEGVRRRVEANFGLKLPPISGIPEKFSGSREVNSAADIPEGQRVRDRTTGRTLIKRGGQLVPLD